MNQEACSLPDQQVSRGRETSQEKEYDYGNVHRKSGRFVGCRMPCSSGDGRGCRGLATPSTALCFDLSPGEKTGRVPSSPDTAAAEHGERCSLFEWSDVRRACQQHVGRDGLTEQRDELGLFSAGAKQRFCELDVLWPQRIQRRVQLVNDDRRHVPIDEQLV